MANDSNTDSVARVIALSALEGGYTEEDILVDEKIGKIEPGTFYPAGTPIRQIIYEMVHGSPQSRTVTFYYGATDEIPTSITGLQSKSLKLYQLIGGYTQHITAGNTTTKQGQYVTVAIPKDYKISKWCVVGFEYNIPNTRVVSGNNAIYYLNLPSYDVDENPPGIDYIITVTS